MTSILFASGSIAPGILKAFENTVKTREGRTVRELGRAGTRRRVIGTHRPKHRDRSLGAGRVVGIRNAGFGRASLTFRCVC
jgi:hypothetical protein